MDEGLVSRLFPSVPFPFGGPKPSDKLLFGDRKAGGFRFENLATEFENDIHEDNDIDSGIDSEDVSTISPGSTASLPSPASSLSSPASSMSSPASLSSLSSPTCRPAIQTEPMSLVVRDMNRPRDPPRTPKHWKKSISRNYDGENSENSSENRLKSPLDTSAHALLSLSRPHPYHPRNLPVALPPSRPLVPMAPSRPLTQPRIVQPWAIPASRQNHTSGLSDYRHISGLTHPRPISGLSSHQLPTSGLSEHRPTSGLSEHRPTSGLSSHQLPTSGLSTPTHLPLIKKEAMLDFPALPQIPAPLQEVQYNLQLTSRPPVSVIGWHQPPPSSPQPLFQHSIFSENLEEVGSSTDKPFTCPECRKCFSTQSGFAKHQQLHCSNQIQRDFSCKFCGKSYTSLSALKMHVRTHTLPCKCPECGKSFSRPWLLQGHMRTHTGEKPFGCTHCARSFADKSNLRAHLQTHLQNKKYSCPGCQKTFSRMSLLNKHTDSGCVGLQTRNEECVETLVGLSTGLLRS